MEAYLLDCNTISDWFDETRPRHRCVAQRAEESAQSDAVLVTSTVDIGEIEYGIKVAPQQKMQALNALLEQVDIQFVRRRFLLAPERSTALVYGDLRARLFEKFAPKNRRRKGLRPEELVDPVTAKELGIQENDLWIAAQAIERNLILVTNDGMACIREVAPELRVEDWAAAAP